MACLVGMERDGKWLDDYLGIVHSACMCLCDAYVHGTEMVGGMKSKVSNYRVLWYSIGQ